MKASLKPLKKVPTVPEVQSSLFNLYELNTPAPPTHKQLKLENANPNGRKVKKKFLKVHLYVNVFISAFFFFTVRTEWEVRGH